MNPRKPQGTARPKRRKTKTDISRISSYLTSIIIGEIAKENLCDAVSVLDPVIQDLTNINHTMKRTLFGAPAAHKPHSRSARTRPLNHQATTADEAAKHTP